MTGLSNEQFGIGDSDGDNGNRQSDVIGNSTNRSGGEFDGSGRNVDGNDRRNGDESTATGTVRNVNSVDANRNESSEFESVFGVDSGEIGTHGNGGEQRRQRRSIRLGDSGNRNSDTEDERYSTGNVRTENRDSVNDSEPVVRLGKRGRGRPKKIKSVETEKNVKLSEIKNYVKIFTESIFDTIAVSLKHDHWKLTPEESKQLNDALMDWIASMPESNQSKFLSFASKNLPTVNLIFVGFFIVSERVKASIAINNFEKKQNKAVDKIFETVVNNNNQNTVRTPMDSMFS